MNFKLAYYKVWNVKSQGRIEEVIEWASHNNIDIVEVNDNNFSLISWNTINALWFPMMLFSKSKNKKFIWGGLRDIPKNIKIILDYDDNKADENLEKLLEDRPIAIVRAFSNFRPYNLNIKMDTFYWHLPKNIISCKPKDIIVIDIAKSKRGYWHSNILNILYYLNNHYEEICFISKKRIKFYLNGLTPFSGYMDAVKGFNNHFENAGNLLNIANNIISSEKDKKKYNRILSRTRLFITDHNDMADIGLFESIMNDIPIFIVNISPFDFKKKEIVYSMKKITQSIDSSFLEYLDNINSSLLVKNDNPLELFNFKRYRVVDKSYAKIIFNKCWNDIWKWIITEQVSKEYKDFLEFNNLKKLMLNFEKYFDVNTLNIVELRTTISLKKEAENIYFFGASEGFNKICSELPNKILSSISGVFDNDINKHGKLINNIPIISPEKIFELKPNKVFITSVYFREIYNQLILIMKKNSLDIKIFNIKNS